MKKKHLARLRNLTTGLILSAAIPSAMAANIDFFEASSAKGTAPWNSADNLAAYTLWRNAIVETPDYGEDWDGNDWQGNPWVEDKVFDIADEPTAIFVDGVTFSNVGADANREAQAEDNPGSTDAIDKFAWQGHESGASTIYFANLADYLGFYIFDSDKEVSYHVKFSNGDEEAIAGKETDEDLYRFVGFVNTHPTARIEKFWIVADDGSRYGIDELEWGRFDKPVPEPGTLLLLSLGTVLLLAGRKRL
jgi:hypothetical protein